MRPFAEVSPVEAVLQLVAAAPEGTWAAVTLRVYRCVAARETP